MPLPAGFKVNGVKTTSRIPLPPRVQKIITVLDALPLTELKTTTDVSELIGVNINGGGANCHPGLRDYREKVDNKMFWGSRASIAQLRKSLSEGEENNA